MAVPAASVVLVEDAIPYARLVELILADAVPGGVEVRHHERVGTAVADLRERDADCVLLDLGLPDANGLEAVSQVLSVAGGVPVIVLSGHDDDELAVAAIRAGAQDYLVKGQESPPSRFIRAIRFAIERRRAQERSEDLLRAKEDRWRTLTHLAPVGILEIDSAGRCMFANDWVADITSCDVEELLGDGWRGVFGREATAAFADSTRDDFSLEVGFGARWAHVTGALLRDPWGGPAGWLATLVDVTEAREAREQLRDLARTDPLTGLANRRLWDERLAVELARAERYGRPLCVAALDLDRFKPYNDTHGHQAGDALLRETAIAWQGALRGSDLLSRLGGDEFAVLLPDCDLDCARSIVERLQAVTPGGEAGVGSSAGLVTWRAGEDAGTVVARADAALYAAKDAGRGGISVG
jgi:diguanylate cyclase (GGDEF)-like protein/PAS domain S-box-containing protein